MHGSSQASVTIRKTYVVKIGRNARAQGEWLSQHQMISCLPRVTELLQDGYVMEKLEESELPTAARLNRIANKLSNCVWNKSPIVAFDRDVHELKLDALLGDSSALRQQFLRTSWALNWRLLTRCLTHGDCTAENFMMRGEEIILIDPVPATPAVPDYLSVDIGKMLQSAFGWENMRYGDIRNNVSLGSDLVYDAIGHISDKDWEAAHYWSAVHFVRTLPYIPVRLHEEVKFRAREILRRL